MSNIAREQSQDVAHNNHTESAVVPHNEVFRNLSYTEILSGEVPINLMDYISFKLKKQYKVQHGLLTLSYLHAKICAGEQLSNCEVIPQDVFGLQMHFIQNHYIVSCQIPPKIYVIDSLRNAKRISQLLPQLQLQYMALQYGKLPLNDITYCVLHSQGYSVDCGPFAVANAVLLLNNIDPSSVNLHQHRLRAHIFQCLYNGKFVVFPCEDKSTHADVTVGKTATPRTVYGLISSVYERKSTKKSAALKKKHEVKKGCISEDNVNDNRTNAKKVMQWMFHILGFWKTRRLK